ncbi:helix-turn-helix domain-containing protein [Desulfosporosinus shakirovi]|uniref:helix-turn-helix domain-containing protein n=1 Tax=Desulfosporosinus shakirovi TaxID=2885154 RepID=UPI001E46083C|nr:helix-turn-helix domain-containing protein [Desulfosporosinus sp. SRJS8]MCB8815728.1 helix-turn-helix domain-containing protein [Desulfosporosinus sp. SRJS8]
MITKETLTLTIPQVAEILGISRGLAYQLARSGQLPVLRLGNRMLMSRIRLDEFIKNGV